MGRVKTAHSRFPVDLGWTSPVRSAARASNESRCMNSRAHESLGMIKISLAIGRSRFDWKDPSHRKGSSSRGHTDMLQLAIA